MFAAFLISGCSKSTSMPFSVTGSTEVLPLKKIVLLKWEPEIFWYAVRKLTFQIGFH